MNTKNPIHILLIEDDLDDLLFLKEALAESRAQSFHVTHAGRLDAGVALLARGGIDVVLLDPNLPDSCGLNTLKTLLDDSIRVPIVVMSGLEDEAIALKCVQQGVQDYLVKGMADAEQSRVS